MKTAISSSVITLLCVFCFLQFQQNRQLRSDSGQLAASLSNQVSQLELKCGQAEAANLETMSSLLKGVLAETDRKIQVSEGFTTSGIEALTNVFPSQLEFRNLKFEHESLESKVAQLKFDQVEGDHQLSQSIYRLSETLKPKAQNLQLPGSP